MVLPVLHSVNQMPVTHVMELGMEYAGLTTMAHGAKPFVSPPIDTCVTRAGIGYAVRTTTVSQGA